VLCERKNRAYLVTATAATTITAAAATTAITAITATGILPAAVVPSVRC